MANHHRNVVLTKLHFSRQHRNRRYTFGHKNSPDAT
jgi:hypothetical protein